MTESVLGGVEPVRAPRGNNLAAIAPPRDAIAELLNANHAFWSSGEVPSWIRDLRGAARRQLAPVAREYTNSYLSGPLVPESELRENRTWIVGGHQPELFHPGVWFKNILIDRLAKETASVGLHAIVDHDLLRTATLRVPTRDTQRHIAHATLIPLPLAKPSTPDALLPWNAWQVDGSKIDRVCDEIQRALGSVGIQKSMASDFFHQLGNVDQSINAAVALSQVRHRMERRHGVGNWEFPISHLCGTAAWRTFVAHCVSHAKELNHTYNTCLEEYRAGAGITNPAQPVPRLGRQGEWVELPFWIRLPGQFTRYRMWVEFTGSRCRVAIDPGNDGTVIDWNDRFWDASWVVWPRALMTTLFLRVFVADVFVHGIGGGQYDRLTDTIIERFLRLKPPGFVTCTSTLWLEFPHADRCSDDQLAAQGASLERERQRLRSAPEHYLAWNQPDEKNLWEEHQRLRSAIPPRGQKKAWHVAMTSLKSKISAAVESHRRDWDHRKNALEARVLEQRILQSREFSYVLFEESDLFARLLTLAKC